MIIFDSDRIVRACLVPRGNDPFPFRELRKLRLIAWTTHFIYNFVSTRLILD